MAVGSNCFQRWIALHTGFMNAQTLNCYSCGAPVVGDSPNCDHCGARLQTISCPCCFGMLFTGSKFCPHCGTAAAEWQEAPSEMTCPACAGAMLQGTLGTTRLHECGACFGLWLDPATFDGICRDSEQRAAVLGAAVPFDPQVGSLQPVRYRPCPTCREPMTRTNFARCSGVIIDVCHLHGTWFDANELQQIVKFVQEGGLDVARTREQEALVEERRRLEAARSSPPIDYGMQPTGQSEVVDLVLDVGTAVLRHWLNDRF